MKNKKHNRHSSDISSNLYNVNISLNFEPKISILQQNFLKNNSKSNHRNYKNKTNMEILDSEGSCVTDHSKKPQIPKCSRKLKKSLMNLIQNLDIEELQLKEEEVQPNSTKPQKKGSTSHRTSYKNPSKKKRIMQKKIPQQAKYFKVSDVSKTKDKVITIHNYYTESPKYSRKFVQNYSYSQGENNHASITQARKKDQKMNKKKSSLKSRKRKIQKSEVNTQSKEDQKLYLQMYRLITEESLVSLRTKETPLPIHTKDYVIPSLSSYELEAVKPKEKQGKQGQEQDSNKFEIGTTELVQAYIQLLKEIEQEEDEQCEQSNLSENQIYDYSEYETQHLQQKQQFLTTEKKIEQIQNQLSELEPKLLEQTCKNKAIFLQPKTIQPQQIVSYKSYQNVANQFIEHDRRQSQKQRVYMELKSETADFYDYERIERMLDKKYNIITYEKHQQKQRLELRNDLTEADKKSILQKIDREERNQKYQIIKAKKRLWVGYQQAQAILKENFVEKQRKASKKSLKMKSFSLEDLKILYPQPNIRHFEEKKLQKKLKPKQEEGEALKDPPKNQRQLVAGEDKPLKMPEYLNSSFLSLNNEDKEDIFEFIFVDMMIQLYQDGLQKAVKEKIENHYSVRILKAVNDHIHRQKKIAAKPGKRGLDLSISKVKQYLDVLKSTILSLSAEDATLKPSITLWKQQFLLNHSHIFERLAQPLGPTAAELLISLRGSASDESEQQDDKYALIMPVDLFVHVEKTIVKIESKNYNKVLEDPESQTKRILFLRNAEHIHNKAVFDCLNEMFDKVRAYGIWGEPFPWKKTPSFSHAESQGEKNSRQKLEAAVNKVTECTNYMCGLMEENESGIGSSIHPMYLDHIREERMSKMLINELMENEDKFLFYSDEETDILVDVSHLVESALLKEAAVAIQALRF